MSTTDQAAPRLTPSQRLHEVTMAALHRTAAPPEHSVNIARNAKGVVQLDITVRGYDLELVVADALSVYALLAADHPYTEGAAS